MWSSKHTTLLNRLNVIDRGEDVIGITEALLAALAAEEGKTTSEFSPEARALLQSYPWPGNIRELQNAVRHAVVMHNEPVITAAMLPHRIQKAAGIAPMETEAPDISLLSRQKPQSSTFRIRLLIRSRKGLYRQKVFGPLRRLNRKPLRAPLRAVVETLPRHLSALRSRAPRFIANSKNGGGPLGRHLLRLPTKAPCA